MKRIDMEKRLIEVYQFIEDFIEKKHFPPTVREICAKFSIKSTATVQLYLEKLKQRGFLESNPYKKRAISIIKKKPVKTVPLIGVINAGKPIFAVENIEGYYPLPPGLKNADNMFALRVQGDSMIKCGMLDRDIIIVEKTNTAENGQIVVALVEDGATVKRFFKTKTQVILHPENDDMRDMAFDYVYIIGVVRALFRRI